MIEINLFVAPSTAIEKPQPGKFSFCSMVTTPREKKIFALVFFRCLFNFFKIIPQTFVASGFSILLPYGLPDSEKGHPKGYPIHFPHKVF
jgi:hypothetical protein